MKARKIIIVFTLLFFSASSYAVEITPLFGYRTGGEFIDRHTSKKHNAASTKNYGIIIGFPDRHGKTIELYYSHQSSNLRAVSLSATASSNNADIPLSIDYLHLGGKTPIHENARLKTFVSGGLGITYLNPGFINTQ